MQDSNLLDKAINIKGKKYILVADRVVYFNETYPNGCIKTHLVTPPQSEQIIIRASVYPDGFKKNEETNSRVFTAYSQATKGDGYINKTSALENAETSAVGRALAFMGIGVIESIASVDEINKAEGSQHAPTKPQAVTQASDVPFKGNEHTQNGVAVPGTCSMCGKSSVGRDGTKYSLCFSCKSI